MSPNDADRMANSIDPDQTAPDLGLHCLPRHICPKTLDHYGRINDNQKWLLSLFSGHGLAYH